MAQGAGVKKQRGGGAGLASKSKSASKKKPLGPRKGRQYIAPKKAKGVKADKFKKQLQKQIGKRIEQEITQAAQKGGIDFRVLAPPPITSSAASSSGATGSGKGKSTGKGKGKTLEKSLLGGYGSASPSASEITDSEGEEEGEEKLQSGESRPVEEEKEENEEEKNKLEEQREEEVEQGEEGSSRQSISYYGLGVREHSDNHTSSSEDEEDDCYESGDDSSTNTVQQNLPLPDFNTSDEEEAKLAVLKQHVCQLSQSKEPKRERRKKWGKGRGGKHRRDVTFGAGEQARGGGGGHERGGSGQERRGGGGQWFDDQDSSQSAEGRREGKHRSGLTGTLEPPKKFMKSHQGMQRNERPWTYTVEPR